MSGDGQNHGISAAAMAPIRLVFFQECEEQLAELETGLSALENGEGDPDTINALFRAVHSIKGGAGIFALHELVAFAHTFENALSDLRAGKIEADAATIKLMLRANDILADLVRASRDGANVSTARVEPIAQALTALTGAEPQSGDEIEGLDFMPLSVAFEPIAAAPVAQTYNIRFRPYADLYAKANDPLLLLRELQTLGDMSVTLDDSNLPWLPDLEPEEGYLAWFITLTTEHDNADIRAVFEFVDGDCDLEIKRVEAALPAFEALPGVLEPTPALEPETKIVATAAAAAQTIRVDLERVDRLINLVSELVINQAMLAQRTSDQGLTPMSPVGLALEDLDRLVRDLQDNVMAIRAQPVKTVFQRMSRLVREMEVATGKQAALVTEGEMTEVDRTVIERLADPLTHMIRNAMDHGLETPEQRIASGKSPQGQIKLTAAHRGGRIVVQVADDGAGLNRPRVRARAIERGLIEANTALSEAEIDNLIFAPGFSTVEQVSDLSGRGVGMDVVKRSVMDMGGRIALTSVDGHGVTISFSLPLTLAVLDGMVVSCAGQSVVAPLTSLIETVQPRPQDIRQIGPRQRLLAVRGAHVPLIDLSAALGYASDHTITSRGVALLVEDESGERAALLVDDIIGQSQVVIKSLEANYRQVPGIAAATILGDGRVALILDINAILIAERQTPRPTPRLAA